MNRTAPIEGTPFTVQFVLNNCIGTKSGAVLVAWLNPVDAWATWEPCAALAETNGQAGMQHACVLGSGLLPGPSYLGRTDAALAAKLGPATSADLGKPAKRCWSSCKPIPMRQPGDAPISPPRTG